MVELAALVALVDDWAESGVPVASAIAATARASNPRHAIRDHMDPIGVWHQDSLRHWLLPRVKHCAARNAANARIEHAK